MVSASVLLLLSLLALLLASDPNSGVSLQAQAPDVGVDAHAAGLGHSPSISDIMGPLNISDTNPQNNLSTDDKNAMKSIYEHHASH